MAEIVLFIGAMGITVLGVILCVRGLSRYKYCYFKSDLLNGIEKNMLEWEDVCVLAKLWNQSNADIHKVLSDLLHDTLSEKKDYYKDNKNHDDDKHDDNKEKFYHKIKELLKEQQKNEPFSELPESIRIHIETISSRFSQDDDETLRPLVTSICDTIVEVNKKAERQRKIAMFSFLIGLASLLVGIASMVFAIKQINAITPPAPASPSVVRIETESMVL